MNAPFPIAQASGSVATDFSAQSSARVVGDRETEPTRRSPFIIAAPRSLRHCDDKITAWHVSVTAMSVRQAGDRNIVRLRFEWRVQREPRVRSAPTGSVRDEFTAHYRHRPIDRRNGGGAGLPGALPTPRSIRWEPITLNTLLGGLSAGRLWSARCRFSCCRHHVLWTPWSARMGLPAACGQSGDVAEKRHRSPVRCMSISGGTSLAAL